MSCGRSRLNHVHFLLLEFSFTLCAKSCSDVLCGLLPSQVRIKTSHAFMIPDTRTVWLLRTPCSVSYTIQRTAYMCKILQFVDRASCNDSWWMNNVTHKFLSMYLFLFITLYMFRAHRANHQERQIVSIQLLVTVTLCWWPCRVHTTRSPTQSDSYQRLYWHNLSLLMMSTMCSKHVES